jgi:hypothetical protein
VRAASRAHHRPDRETLARNSRSIDVAPNDAESRASTPPPYARANAKTYRQMPPLPGPTSSSKSLRRASNSRASRGDDRADCATTKRRLALTERDCFCALDRLLESTRFDARTGADARRSARRDRAIARTRDRGAFVDPAIARTDARARERAPFPTLVRR